jgi:peptidoglycan/xylan/chitin deacetylase (PgdA/CDA1 family)
MTGHFCTPTTQLLAGLAVLCLLGALVPIGLGGRRGGSLARLLRVLGLALLMLGLGGLGFAWTRPCTGASAACTGVALTGDHNLLANPDFAAPPLTVSEPLTATTVPQPTSWTISGTLQSGLPAGWVGPATGDDLQSARILVRPGDTLCYDIETGGGGQAQAIVQWESQTLEPLQKGGSFSAGPPTTAGTRLQGAATAPAGAVYAWLWLRAVAGTPRFHAPALAQAGLRIEPWPDGAQAALAFSFDWESAMGGLIHSKGGDGHDVAYAEARGRNMRAGADILDGLFQRSKIRATFYATGYNLLDGNTAHRQFAGNPIYPFGPKWGWADDWWLTHRWYENDPYGTVQTAPAWYFGDQTDRLRAAGDEIASHTFGHLYVRGTLPISLTLDLDEWAGAAQARGLPPVRSFAFPWQSSNSSKAETYKVLADHGIDSVTRLYAQDVPGGDYFTLSAVRAYPSLAVMPDRLLGPPGPDSGDSSASLDVAGANQAQAVISETIARRGVTSFWTHPEELTKPDGQTRAAWADTIAAAAAARDRGDLWIAPVSEIVQRWRDVRQVDMVMTGDGTRFNATVTNHSPHPLAGLTLTLPRAARSLKVDGVATTIPRPDMIILPSLAQNAQIRVEAELEPVSAP